MTLRGPHLLAERALDSLSSLSSTDVPNSTHYSAYSTDDEISRDMLGAVVPGNLG